MKLLFHKIRIPLIAGLLVVTAAFAVQAQDPRIQTVSLDHLVAKASRTIDVNVDERLMKMAAKLLSDKDIEEREIKQLVAGIKGIYVKSFEFDADGQYTAARRRIDSHATAWAIMEQNGECDEQERRWP